jgi:hypothetical protein
MGLVTVALLGVLVLKMVAVLNAIRWLHRHGPAYHRLLVANPPAGVADRERLIERHGGSFFPFGVKDYRLRRFLATTRNGPSGPSWRWAVRPVARVFQSVLFQFGWLAPMCAVALVAAASAPEHLLLLPRWSSDAAGLLLGLLLMATTILIVVEAVYGYALLGSYGVGFHLLDPAQFETGRRMLRELQVFTGTVMTALLGGVGVVHFTSVRFGGYGQLTGEVTAPADIVGRAADSAYYTFIAFLGSGEAGPRGVAAKLVVGLLGMEGFALLVLALGVLASVTTPPRLPIPATGDPPPVRAGAAPRDPRRRPADRRRRRRGRLVFGAGGALVAVAVAAVIGWVIRRRRPRLTALAGARELTLRPLDRYRRRGGHVRRRGGRRRRRGAA